jgi:stage V sporulation protein B
MSNLAAEMEQCRPAGQRHEPVRHIIRNSALTLVSQGLNSACNLIVIFVLARGEGKAALGEYFTLFALIIAVQLLLEAGLSTVLTYRIAQTPETWRSSASEAAGLFLIVAAASAGVLLLAGMGWGLLTGTGRCMVCFGAAACACAAIQAQRFYTGVFRAFERFREESFAQVLQGGLFTAAVVTLTVANLAGLESALISLAVSHVVAGFFLAAAFRWRWSRLTPRLDRSTMRDWLAEGVLLGFGDVVRGLTWQLDTLLLGVLQPAAVVGIYSVAYRPLLPLNWLPRTVLTAAFPAFSRMAATDLGSFKQAFANSTRLLWVISIPIAVAIFVCAEPLIVLLAGPAYLEAVAPMRILIWIACLSFLSMQFRFLFTALGKQRVFARLVAMVLVIEVVMELWLIPYWGYFGACAGSLAGELFFTAAGLWICYRMDVGQIAWTALLAASAAGAAMGASLWFFREAALPLLLLATMVATGLYFVVCVLLRALHATEILQLYTALATLGARPTD